jgi:hypothetical protein
MSGYVLKGKTCTAENCWKTTTYTTPRGKTDNRDEQGRCPKCSAQNRPLK